MGLLCDKEDLWSFLHPDRLPFSHLRHKGERYADLQIGVLDYMFDTLAILRSREPGAKNKRPQRTQRLHKVQFSSTRRRSGRCIACTRLISDARRYDHPRENLSACSPRGIQRHRNKLFMAAVERHREEAEVDR